MSLTSLDKIEKLLAVRSRFEVRPNPAEQKWEGWTTLHDNIWTTIPKPVPVSSIIPMFEAAIYCMHARNYCLAAAGFYTIAYSQPYKPNYRLADILKLYGHKESVEGDVLDTFQKRYTNYSKLLAQNSIVVGAVGGNMEIGKRLEQAEIKLKAGTSKPARTIPWEENELGNEQAIKTCWLLSIFMMRLTCKSAQSWKNATGAGRLDGMLRKMGVTVASPRLLLELSDEQLKGLAGVMSAGSIYARASAITSCFIEYGTTDSAINKAGTKDALTIKEQHSLDPNFINFLRFSFIQFARYSGFQTMILASQAATTLGVSVLALLNCILHHRITAATILIVDILAEIDKNATLEYSRLLSPSAYYTKLGSNYTTIFLIYVFKYIIDPRKRENDSTSVWSLRSNPELNSIDENEAKQLARAAHHFIRELY